MATESIEDLGRRIIRSTQGEIFVPLMLAQLHPAAEVVKRNSLRD